MIRVLLVLILALAAAAPAAAGLVPFGEGTLRWFGLKIYDATLWTAGGPPDDARPFRLELRYARALRGAAIAERSAEEIARLGLGTPAQRAAWREAMLRLFPDVAAGDALAGEYRPGEGARFTRNGLPLGEIADPAFSRAFFAIWLDARTSEPGLRAALIGAP